MEVNINSMHPSSGRMIREDNTFINQANYLAPVPNGDETIVVATAGVKTLTPPNAGNTRAVITNPVAVWVRFNSAPAVNTGTYYNAYQGIVLESTEEMAQARFYVTEATTLFIQYFK